MKSWKKIIAAALAAVVFAAGTATARAADWPSFRGTAAGTTSAALPASADGAMLGWETKLSGSWGVGAPVISGGSIYITVKNRLLKLEKATGRTVSSCALAGDTGYFCFAAADGKRLYIPISNGRVEAVDKASMKPLWTSAAIGADQTISPVLVSGGRVYTGTCVPGKRGAYICLDSATGKTVWKYEGGKGYYWAGAAEVSGSIVFGGDDGKLICHSPDTSAVTDTLAVGGELRSTVASYGGRAYFSSKDGYICSVRVSGGRFSDLKRTKTGGTVCSPVIAGGRVYICAGSTFYVIDAAAMRVISKTPVGAFSQSSALVSTAGGKNTAYISTNAADGGGVLAVTDNGSTASVKRIIDPRPDWCTASLVTDGADIFYTNDSGYLFCIKKAKAPSPPAGLVSKPKSAVSARISWKPSVSASGYAVYKSTKKSGGFKKAATVSGTSYTLKGLRPGRTYYVRVKPYVNVNGKKLWGKPTPVLKLRAVPKAPSGVKLTGGRLSWKSSSGAAGYKITASSSPSGGYKAYRTAKKASLAVKKGRWYRVCAYVKYNGKKIYGPYSAAVKG